MLIKKATAHFHRGSTPPIPKRSVSKRKHKRLSLAMLGLALCFFSSQTSAQTNAPTSAPENTPTNLQTNVLTNDTTADTERENVTDSSRQARPASNPRVELTEQEAALTLEPLQALFLQSYQRGDWPKAMAISKELVRREPRSATMHYNQGLVYAQIDQLGMAVAKFRGALSLSPSLSSAQDALGFVERKLKLSDEIDTYSWWFRLHDSVFRYLSLRYLAFICVYLLATTGFLLIRYYSKRKIANLAEEMPPGFPVLASVFLGTLIVALGATACKWQFAETDFATIVSSKATALSAPNETALSLFELVEGEEIIVERADKNFYQVLSGRGLSGWISNLQLVDSNLRH